MQVKSIICQKKAAQADSIVKCWSVCFKKNKQPPIPPPKKN